MSEAAKVKPHPDRRFATSCVVFWHDRDGQYAADLVSLKLRGAAAIPVADDECAMKHRLLHDHPGERVLAPVRSPLVRTLNDGKRILL